MSRTVLKESRSQQTLQSYLDALLQDAVIGLAESVSHDEFQAAVFEEQQRDIQRVVPLRQVVLPEAEPQPAFVPEPEPEVMAAPVLVVQEALLDSPLELPPLQALESVEPVAELVSPAHTPGGPPARSSSQPEWGEEPFECLLFDVAGLTLAVPLVSLGSIYPLAGHDLTPLFGQPSWFLGILPSQAGNLKVLDTARWVMAERYRDDFRDGLQYVISVQGYEWGLAVHQVSRSIRLDPKEVKWRSQRSQRPWLAGTVIDHMCALVDVAALAELIASGATRHLKGVPS
ncbi:chemotaxis protein CheW [Stutzerimonas zhaodongensis]|uniref:Chemotaxis protein CheW n=1 Tax=Stutzerimonas zhaodongensis TaxID=1176257 RepID=A0A3M2I1J3_9GAMM|nr:CheW domain-containing protein [Stutzerimonas zhaodongensis]MCQ2031135.1 chemotaxis protein CheW [Stutzerimonas zhaodongensis]MCQ4314817.1 chemotaxis protein CheW [Stutzerimonas zhaodongensis]RMH92317.1 chemotaxis protein CheW [Stutzerimonas zhaodongensis]